MCRLEREFENGCVFKLEIQPNEKLTKIHYKGSKDKIAQWEKISKNQNNSDPFFITEKKDSILYVKVENFFSSGEIDFQFLLMDNSKGNDNRPIYCRAVQITGMHLGMRRVRAEKLSPCMNLATFKLFS